ncbi:putative coiled-coil domain-containing protein 195 [Gymnogyps californianus]|uniref:putative coiled-coil domain-containing protein 195 n=1 Tax=Gymnogyps californianus TaxID=33616 RepID=UPI0021C8B8A2|nr:putative coiled-coil domain-containing protein 195 [Gymnogyps californianus]
MEGNAHLLQVIRKMRSQINKLERENRALRGELQVCGQRAVPPEREAARGGGNGDVRSLANDGEGPAGSPASLHGSIVASPAPAPKEQTDTTMTVRRYSAASPAPAPSSARGKVKAVSFLLPMDMSSYAEKQGSLKSPQNQSTKQLTTIAEKDM